METIGNTKSPHTCPVIKFRRITLETLNGVRGVQGVKNTRAWLAEEFSARKEIVVLELFRAEDLWRSLRGKGVFDRFGVREQHKHRVQRTFGPAQYRSLKSSEGVPYPCLARPELRNFSYPSTPYLAGLVDPVLPSLQHPINPVLFMSPLLETPCRARLVALQRSLKLLLLLNPQPCSRIPRVGRFGGFVSGMSSVGFADFAGI